MDIMRNRWGFLFWLFCSAILIASILIIRPGWGLMDDTQNLQDARNFLSSPVKVAAYADLFNSDIINNGRYRPFYFVWIISAYSFFRHNPTGFYLFIVSLALLFLPVWGKLLRDSYGKEYQKSSFLLWAYPVSFFLFTPFWNSFMYLSVLEKFIYFFSAPAFMFFLKTYQQRRSYLFIFAALAGLFALISKETGIAIFMTFFLFSCFCAIFFKSHRKISIGLTLVNGGGVCAYYFFIKSVISGYSSSYKGFSMLVIFQNLMHGPLVIKLLFALAVISAAHFCYKSIKSGDISDFFPALWPFFVISYLLVLSPWGYMSYLLAPLGPAVMGMFVPLYFNFWRQGKMKAVKTSLFGLACIFCLFWLIIPRIFQVASVKGVTGFLKSEDISYGYLFPATSPETPIRLSELSGRKIKYIQSGVIGQQDLPSESAFLILDSLCAPVDLIDLKPGKIVYRSNYWLILKVERAFGRRERFQTEFPRTFLQRIVRLLKKY